MEGLDEEIISIQWRSENEYSKRRLKSLCGFYSRSWWRKDFLCWPISISKDCSDERVLGAFKEYQESQSCWIVKQGWGKGTGIQHGTML